MELNAERHFSAVPSTFIDHSRFTIPYDWTVDIYAGLLNCFYIDEWIPGDIHNLTTSHLTRMTTPIAAPFDTCFLDVYYFFVPWRLVWNHAKEFFGENNSTYWTQPTEYTIPSVNIYSWTRTKGDLLHQMGITLRPSGNGDNALINTLQMRSYQKVWNDFFRDENTQAPIAINMADNGDTSTLNTLLPVNRIHDMFGSCLPGAQKSAGGVALALEGLLPVASISSNWSEAVLAGVNNSAVVSSLVFKNGSGNTQAGNLGSNASGQAVNTTGTNTSTNTVHPVNLAAQASAGKIDINQFRLALQTQKVLEALARGGSRYVEILQSIYGVRSDDARLQRPEFLGGERWYLNMSDNVQTSETGTTPLGTVGGYSKTFGRSQNAPVSYSVREHGFGIGVCCIRHNRSYSQMIPKQFRRTNFFSIYNPKFAHIGEQPVYLSEICADYASSTSPYDPSKVIFGYQEYAYEYRWKNSILAGSLAPGAEVVPAGQPGAGDPTALGTIWTYGDYYKTAPSLSDTWMREGSEAIARTLQVPTESQFFCSIHVDDDAIRPMPMYSVPGFVDHF